MKRTLRLRSESLTELTTDELGGVAGAQELSLLSCPALRCLLDTLVTCVVVRTRDCVVVDPPTMPQNCYTFPWC